jgi:hypothetical protein
MEVSSFTPLPLSPTQARVHAHTYARTKEISSVPVSSKAVWAVCRGEERKTSVRGENTRVIEV